MKIAITGASGFVGRMLVPLLAAGGAELLLAGRDPAALALIFPGYQVCGYADLARRAEGHDQLLHLAAVNSDADAVAADFHAVNVGFTLELAAIAKTAGIARMVNASSTHALDAANTSAYAETKRTAAQALAAIDGIEIVTLYLAAVHGARWSGRLGLLNRLPRPLARLAFPVLAALKPTLHIERLADFILHPAPYQLGQELILADDQDANPVYCVAKRLIDLLFVLVVVGLFGWGLVLIWGVIRLGSTGSGLFAQQRIGRFGKVFTCYKFRTMKPGTPQTATHEVSAAAVTPFGAFLRRSKLDELPQVWNILHNQISLVGPRPCLPVQSALIAARGALGVLTIKPGITGLAQINGIDMSRPEELARWDARYKGLRSILLDLRIILATARGSGRGDRLAR